ncbi:MlaE family ABC transporter permease [Erythrobacter sp. MTPC3]|uniref:MlaE family ABC transporter permease n=1 Tax=Erythrobacter sp. MTPC3 TaxID=3056564 RepID=UPI0036F20EF8
MNGAAQYTLDETADGGAQLALSGPFLISSVGAVDHELFRISGPIREIEVSGIDDIDTTGAYVIVRLASDHDARITGASNSLQRVLDAIDRSGNDVDIGPDRPPVWKRVPIEMGEKVYAARSGVYGVVGFFGLIMLGMGNLMRRPRSFPMKALVHQMELVGVAALPIIGLMSFLIGVVIAQQGAVQLEQFGAEALTVNLVGRLTLRELGVLMTAIMVAGRSGSAFAAQIGTMKLTEEVDAMRTIGISPIEVLVIPRILACTFMMVLLGFYASMVAIVGGAVVGQLALGIPFFTFLERIQEVVPTYDLWVGLIKAPVFGLIVALAGCYHGMQVKGNSEEVGRRTTMAVVSAIFAVIVLDAFFAVFFTEIGWG